MNSNETERQERKPAAGKIFFISICHSRIEIINENYGFVNETEIWKCSRGVGNYRNGANGPNGPTGALTAFVGYNKGTNNNCEPINHVLKQCTQWRPHLTLYV